MKNAFGTPQTQTASFYIVVYIDFYIVLLYFGHFFGDLKSMGYGHYVLLFTNPLDTASHKMKK